MPPLAVCNRLRRLCEGFRKDFGGENPLNPLDVKRLGTIGRLTGSVEEGSIYVSRAPIILDTIGMICVPQHCCYCKHCLVVTKDSYCITDFAT
jgi:hypothetical protein